MDISDDIFGNIMISVTEAVNNAIKHGNHEDNSKNVELVCLHEEHQLTFIISDEGNGFDPLQLPDPTAPENLLKPGGRGIFLIKNLADEVKFSDDGAKIEMIFYSS